MTQSGRTPGAPPPAHRFPTTRWSVVQAASRTTSPEARAALESLCTTYWPPVHAYIRRCGYSPDDAADLTQAFFARVIEKGDVGHARNELGRFRTFLLTAVRHFLLNPFLTGEETASYSEAARTLQKAEGAVRVSVHRLRRRFGRCLRETLADTVSDTADVDAELAYLLDVLSRRHRTSSLEQP